MDRREFLKMGALTGAALALSNCNNGLLAETNSPASQPNFILCMTDDQGWGSVGYNGLKGIATTSIDAMAANGLRFDRFYAAAPVCSPTRASVLTGRHPFRYGCWNAGSAIDPKEVTIAQTLHSAGYITGHFGKWHLSGGNGTEKLITANDPTCPGKMGFDEWLSAKNHFNTNPIFSRKGKSEKLAGDSSDAIMAEALKFIATATEKKRPFLVVVWFASPHSPNDPMPEDLKSAGGNPFLGELLGVDRSMGTLRASLRKMNIADNTLVWLNSDNGMGGDKKSGLLLKGGKHGIWEGGLRVPGLIEWPAGIPRPMVTALPVVTSDIYPTILELAGVKVPDQIQPLDGISLASLIKGKPMTERPSPIGFWHDTSAKKVKGVSEALDPAKGHAALIDNRYKLHKIEGTFELYDLVVDPMESKNLVTAKLDVVDKMKPILKKWQESVSQSYSR
jgi:arylsulfatase A-like enzyme